MLVKEINYKETSFFSSLFCDYVNNKSELEKLIGRYKVKANYYQKELTW